MVFFRKQIHLTEWESLAQEKHHEVDSIKQTRNFKEIITWKSTCLNKNFSLFNPWPFSDSYHFFLCNSFRDTFSFYDEKFFSNFWLTGRFQGYQTRKRWIAVRSCLLTNNALSTRWFFSQARLSLHFSGRSEALAKAYSHDRRLQKNWSHRFSLLYCIQTWAAAQTNRFNCCDVSLS